MPYAKQLTGGAVIRQHHTGLLIHIDTIDVTDVKDHGATFPTAIITAHAVRTGQPLTDEHSAHLFMTEIVLPGSIVRYHGSETTSHGLYRVTGECPDCPNGDHYRLVSHHHRAELHHVRRSSFTIVRAACTTCPPSPTTYPLTATI